MDRDIRILAFVYRDTGHDTSDIVWSNNNEMSITGFITGIVMLISPSPEVDVASKVYKGIVMAGKVIEKTDDGTWGASAHEEGYQAVKDSILIIGGIK